MKNTLLFITSVMILSAAHANTSEIFTQADICKAGIATDFSREPEIINIDRWDNELVFLSYKVPGSERAWRFKCKVEGDRINWEASFDGRPRNTIGDATITFKIDEDIITIKRTFADGSGNTASYPAIRINGFVEPFSLTRIVAMQKHDNRLFVYEFTGRPTENQMVEYLTKHPPANTPKRMTYAYFYPKGKAPAPDRIKTSESAIVANMLLHDDSGIAHWSFAYLANFKGNRKFANCKTTPQSDLCKH
jgi:hypothetical protein